MTTNVKLMIVLGKMTNVFQKNLGSNLEALGIPFSLYPILAHLDDVGRAKTQKLGEVAVISSGTITHSVNKLEKLGYVEKIQDEKDKRVFWIQITPKGRDIFKEVHKEHMKYLDWLLEGFTQEEKLLLIEQLKHFGISMENKLKQKGE